jgi:hypothetical protein
MAVDTCVSDGQLVITDDTNYSFSSTMTIQSTVVKDATDITFDWSQVTADMFGVQIDPRLDIDHVVISLWRMTETELADNMNKDNLPLGSNQGALTFYPNDAADHANLLEFDSFGNPVPEEDIWLRFDTSTPNYAYPPENHTWMMMVGSGDDATKGAQMLGFFKLDPASTNTVVALTNDSTDLDYTVDLQSIKQIPVPAGMAELSIDWSQMTTNALGNEYVGNQITNAVVAHYSMTLAELEEQFVFLEERSAQWWEANVPSGTSIALNTLEDETGSTFPGIDADGIWLVALRCTINCNNPAPWSITVLKPCP